MEKTTAATSIVAIEQQIAKVQEALNKAREQQRLKAEHALASAQKTTALKQTQFDNLTAKGATTAAAKARLATAEETLSRSREGLKDAQQALDAILKKEKLAAKIAKKTQKTFKKLTKGQSKAQKKLDKKTRKAAETTPAATPAISQDSAPVAKTPLKRAVKAPAKARVKAPAKTQPIAPLNLPAPVVTPAPIPTLEPELLVNHDAAGVSPVMDTGREAEPGVEQLEKDTNTARTEEE